MLAYFTVQEHGDKQSRNTPGGEELMKEWGGGRAGLPFYAFLDSSGTLVITSNEPPGDGRPGGNIGHPDKPHEVDWFLTMIRKAVPRITDQELAAMEKPLRAQKK